jgi:hypothetical protein
LQVVEVEVNEPGAAAELVVHVLRERPIFFYLFFF